MRFARKVFWTAGIYGLLVTLPQLFLEGRASRDFPPPIPHPEIYYGFVGTVLAWQVAFLLIGRDPVRYRPFILVSLIEKGVFGAAVPILYEQGRVPALLLLFAAIDVVFGLLFFEAWRRTKDASPFPSMPPAQDPSDVKRSSEDRSDTEEIILDLRRVMDTATPSPGEK
jgi:hypothetical protein